MERSGGILFVSGDIGGAKMQLPVILRLMDQGEQVFCAADPGGLAGQILKDAGIELFTGNISDLASDKLIKAALIGTCANAWQLERQISEQLIGRVPVVLESDGYLNHCLPAWREAVPDYWLAIDSSHAAKIRECHPQLGPDQVKALGQPAFDCVIDLTGRKRETRADARRHLGVSEDETLVLWWSHGMASVAEEDLEMICAALRSLPGDRNVFLPRLHRQIGKHDPNFIKMATAAISRICDERSIRVIDKSAGFLGEELCLAADLILSITCTEDLKVQMIGGPPVVHFLGPMVQNWFRTDFQLEPPFLPDVEFGKAMAIYSKAEAPMVLAKALEIAQSKEWLGELVAPPAKATGKILDFLLELGK